MLGHSGMTCRVGIFSRSVEILRGTLAVETLRKCRPGVELKDLRLNKEAREGK